MLDYESPHTIAYQVKQTFMTLRKRTQRSIAVTMRDVAELANVSQSTVSRVLNQSSLPIPIGEDTQRRVLDAVKQLGYHPNLYAGSLRGQKTQLIAMMIADIANPFYHPMVRAVQDVAHQHRYDVMVANSDHTRENEVLFCESLIRRPVDGIIMVPYHLTDEEIDWLITRTGAAVAILGSHLHHPQADVVACDDEQATYEAVRWLIEQKQHQRIGIIGVSRTFAVGVRRANAYKRAITEAGLTIPPAYIQTGDWSVESGQQAMRALLALPTPPTAVFACNDHMAIGAILAAQALQLRIPEDVAVVGFDDIPAASWISPKLTTIAQYPTEIGRHLATAVFERIAGRVIGPRRRYDLPCRLIERESA
jgi:LacI family transcriptional regulator/LacI family repressor for deo operon, udp, cdd, tsx, nupC, and nupG